MYSFLKVFLVLIRLFKSCSYHYQHAVWEV